MKFQGFLSIASLIGDDNRPTLGLRLALSHRLEPIPEAVIVGVAPLENDICVLLQARQLSYGLAWFAEGIRACTEPGALMESGPKDSVDL